MEAKWWLLLFWLEPTKYNSCSNNYSKSCFNFGRYYSRWMWYISSQGYYYLCCVTTSTYLTHSDDSCDIADCNNKIAYYSWCTSTHTCILPSDDSWDIAWCEKNCGSDWCFSTQKCLPSTNNFDPKYCKVDSDCKLPSIL